MKLGKYTAFYLLLFSTCLAQNLQPVHPARTEAAPAALLLEYVRAIYILEKGINQNWEADRYLAEYDKVSDLGTSNEIARLFVRNKLAPLTRPHAIWDERPPVGAEASRIRDQCKQERDSLLAIPATSESRGY